MKAFRILALAAVVLIIIGVAYVKALYSEQQRDQKQGGERIPADQASSEFLNSPQYLALVDSLRDFYRDSLLGANQDSLNPERPDSSIASTGSGLMMDSLKAETEKLAAELAQTRQDLASTENENKTQFERLVYRYYQQETAALPSDLSDYEKNVSLNEIRSKAMKYFSLTADSLDRIIKRHRR